MLGNLPKLLDRNFILGFIVPVLLFAVAALLLLRDHTFTGALLDTLLAKDATSAAYAAAAAWLVAILLSLFNHTIYRLLEGYLPPLSWRRATARLFWTRIRQWQVETGDLRDRYDNLTAAELASYNDLRLKLSGAPSTEDDVLPTRFGNAIRAFETYPYDTYGADGVEIWPRLVAVASKEYAAAVQDARTNVDFHINCCVLSVVLAGIALTQIPFADFAGEMSRGWQLASHLLPNDGVWGGELFGVWLPILERPPFGKIVWFAAACFAVRVFYCFAVWAVPAWGTLVKVGFDCYLPKLAEHLGYPLPKNEARRRVFWQQFSAMVTYRTLPSEPPFFKPEDWLFPRKH